MAEKKVRIGISGMTCASCAKTIESSLYSLDGVADVKVDLGAETAEIVFDPKKVDVSSLEYAVKDAGYDVVYENAIVKIGGMTCASCAKTIEKAISAIDGIGNVHVNLSAEKAYITYNPYLVGLEDIKNAIEGAGYIYLGLEGEAIDLNEERTAKELKAKLKRTYVGFLTGAVLLAIMYLPSLHPIIGTMRPYIMLVISAPAFIYVSHPIFTGAIKALKNRNLNMDVMYSMGMGVAFISSIFATFEIILTREFLFYETAVFLATFLTLGRYLEVRAKGKTSEAIKKLISLRPSVATLLRKGEEVEVPVEFVEKGDIVVVKPGDRIPVDGIIVDGESYVDESMITGEPIPVFKHPGDGVIGGTLNKNGILRFKATRVGSETTLAKIIKLVEEAQGTRPKIERIADKAVGYFIPVVLTVSILSFFIWYFVFQYRLLFAITTLISVLVVACPCALGLATPTAVTVGIGRGAELGILIKNGEALERAEKLNVVVFDKTGTITKGRPEVTDIYPINITQKDLLGYAASVEQNSRHPIAEVIVSKAKELGAVIESTEGFRTFGGIGLGANVNGISVLVGSTKFITKHGIYLSKDIKERVQRLEAEGKSVVLVAMDSKIKGIIGISDNVKESAPMAIEELKRMGLEVVMVTGDNRRTARAIGKKVGIDSIVAEVMPEDKVNTVKQMQRNGKVIAFVGDGINDAPALAQADVGIAMGSGTDVAVESGDIVLMKDDLLDAIASIQLSRKVMARIKQNLFWAFAYNTALIPVAMGLLYPTFGIVFRPEFAGLAMAMSSVTVVSLSLLLKRYVPEVKIHYPTKVK